ncbi:MAG: SEC-C domain-containing protein [Candidatus Paceibacterota bacterium]
MKQERNALCSCGSGIKYKYCHMKLENSDETDKLDVAKKIYLKQWSKNSNYFYENKYYNWMAKQLSKYKPKKIFDVGTGTGLGVIELYNKFKCEEIHIVSIDENIECLKAAKPEIFTATDYNPEIISRLSVDHLGPLHAYSYSSIEYSSKDKIVLIESDILTEPCLDDIIDCSGQFDAITVWLIGTHEHRYTCAQIGNRISSSGEYRLRVQNKVYEFADKSLRNGGVLQIVDRGESPKSDVLKNDFINAHRDQASITSLKVEELNFIDYEELSTGIRIELTPGISGRLPTNLQHSLISVISVKP